MSTTTTPVLAGSQHFASTFLEAQELHRDKSRDKKTTVLDTPTSGPLCLFDCDIFCEPPTPTARHATTTRLHLQNVAADSQPSLASSSSNHSSLSSGARPRPGQFLDPLTCPEPRKVNTLPANTSAPRPAGVMDDGRGDSLPKSRTIGKRKTPFYKDIRRTQSEARVDQKKPAKISNGSSFGSLKRALSPFIFGKKKNSRFEEEGMSDEVRRKISSSRHHRDHSGLIVMETGFPVSYSSSVPSLNTAGVGPDSEIRYGSSSCVRGLVSPLVHPRNSLNFPVAARSSSLVPEPSKPTGSVKLSRQRSPVSQSSSPKVLSKQPSPGSVKHSRSSPGESSKESSPVDNTSAGRLPRPPSSTINFSNDLSHAKETLIKPKAVKVYKLDSSPTPTKCPECHHRLPSTPDISNKTLTPHSSPGPPTDGRDEMQDILKRYSPPKGANVGQATLQRKLKEIKHELEIYKIEGHDNNKIGEIRDIMSSRSTSADREGAKPRGDEVFYKRDHEVLGADFTRPSDDDYYKEIEVRINPEGIAVVRRRHRLDTDRKEPMRRSTIHVDDRVFCDKAVLQSIYGYNPISHHSGQKKATHSDSSEPVDPVGGSGGVKLRQFVHQKSVPNLHDAAYSDSEEMSFAKRKSNLVGPDLQLKCNETAKLTREYHRSTASNLPLHRKYIRAYTKFYEQKLATKLLDLNRFIEAEKETRIQLDKRIEKSLLENSELMEALNAAKQDVMKLIEVIETPV